MADSLLGPQYISVANLQSRATAFGCAKAIAAMTSGELEALVALASRAVDGHTGRQWADGTVITENHKWDMVTRRVRVNQPPILTLVSYVLRTSPAQVATFSVTPITNDAGGNPVAFGPIYYNREENYLELASLAVASSLTTPLISLGMFEPNVEIKYTSYSTAPQAVVSAAGLIAADMANSGYLASMGLLSGNIQSVETGNQSIERAVPLPDAYPLPPIAVMLLANITRPAIA